MSRRVEGSHRLIYIPMVTADSLTEARSCPPPKNSLVNEQCGGTAEAQLTVATASTSPQAGKAQVIEC